MNFYAAVPRQLFYEDDEPDQHFGLENDERLLAEMDDLIQIENRYRHNADKTAAELANEFVSVAKKTEHLVQKALLEAERSQLRSNVIAHLAKVVQKTENYQKFIQEYNERKGHPIAVTETPQFRALEHLMKPDLLEPVEFFDYPEIRGILDESIRDRNLADPLIQSPGRFSRSKKIKENEKIWEDLVQAEIDRENGLSEPVAEYMPPSSSSHDDHEDLIFDRFHEHFKTPPKLPKWSHHQNVLDRSIDSADLLRDPLIKAPYNLPSRKDTEMLADDEMAFDDIFGDEMIATPVRPERFVMPEPLAESLAEPSPTDYNDVETNFEQDNYYRDLATGKYRKEAYEENIWSEDEPTLIETKSSSYEHLSDVDAPDFNDLVSPISSADDIFLTNRSYERLSDVEDFVYPVDDVVITNRSAGTQLNRSADRGHQQLNRSQQSTSNRRPHIISSESDVNQPILINDSNILDESRPQFISSESDIPQRNRRQFRRQQTFLILSDENILDESEIEYAPSVSDEAPAAERSILAQGPSKIRRMLEAGWQRTEDLEYMHENRNRDAINTSFIDTNPVLKPYQRNQIVEPIKGFKFRFFFFFLY